MSAVLRGRGGLTFEQALGVLSAAANRELPRQLARIPGGAHFIIVPAFVTGVGSRLYSIDNVVDRRTQKHQYRYTSHQRWAEPGAPSARLVVAGTGGDYLARKARTWARPLRSLVNAHDRGKVSDHVIADQLARLNYEAHQAVRDGSVGPRCIVVWRRRRDARPGLPGGAQQFYTGHDRESDSGALPTIANGLDVQAIVGASMAHIQARVARYGFESDAAFDVDKDELNRQLAKFPYKPDEKLR